MYSFGTVRRQILLQMFGDKTGDSQTFRPQTHGPGRYVKFVSKDDVTSHD